MSKRSRRLLIIAGVLLLAAFTVIALGYWLKWDWLTGFIGGYSKVTIEKTGKETKIITELPQSKSLWDWLNLLGVLAIPAAVGCGTVWFTVQQQKESKAENEDNQRERALQEYIDKMSDLLLKENLRESVPVLSIDSTLVLKGIETKPDEEVRTIARARTLTVLSRLDSRRKGSVIQFLHESRLIEKGKPIVGLYEADLTGANLMAADLWRANLWGADLQRADLNYAAFIEADLGGTHLNGANLSEAYLAGANLWGAILRGATLRGAILAGADLWGANLSTADLIGADLWAANLASVNLSGARVTQEQLDQAKSLKGAIMPDGSTHP